MFAQTDTPKLQTIDLDDPEPYDTLYHNDEVKLLAEFLQKESKCEFSYNHFFKTAGENLMAVFNGSKLSGEKWVNLLITLRDLTDYCKINVLMQNIAKNINAYVCVYKPF
ncbi:MAG TPA: hypothetical protein DCL21_00510 [Alphaproteobacteria bacterium]|nr:hypothetical protein [Alphaproteobacteria bacterium]